MSLVSARHDAMRVPFFQIDAFTDVAFAGNPAAVCVLASWPDDALLLRIAAENNLSETAFVVRGEPVCELRWFTPAAEVPLCGHGTLAAAHVLMGDGVEEELEFRTKSGLLTVVREADAYRLDLPALAAEAAVVTDDVVDALGARPETCLVNDRSCVAVFAAESDIAGLAPDMTRVLALPRPYLIATAPGDACDFVSRFFAPAVGVAEDPVTGSAHCVLAPYWTRRLGSDTLTARQISARGGHLMCRVAGERVHLTGRAVTVIEGSLLLP